MKNYTLTYVFTLRDLFDHRKFPLKEKILSVSDEGKIN